MERSPTFANKNALNISIIRKVGGAAFEKFCNDIQLATADINGIEIRTPRSSGNRVPATQVIGGREARRQQALYGVSRHVALERIHEQVGSLGVARRVVFRRVHDIVSRVAAPKMGDRSQPPLETFFVLRFEQQAIKNHADERAGVLQCLESLATDPAPRFSWSDERLSLPDVTIAYAGQRAWQKNIDRTISEIERRLPVEGILLPAYSPSSSSGDEFYF